MDEVLSCECGAALDAPFPLSCESCGHGLFCLRCSIGGLVMCKACRAQQLAACEEAEAYMKKLQTCPHCDGLRDKLIDCPMCRRHMCGHCVETPSKHRCIRCDMCSSGRKMHRCGCWGMERSFCDACYEQHRTTKCGITMRYRCPNCGQDVYKYGGERYRCVAADCELRYACARCDRIGPHDSVEYACHKHKSARNCPGCHHRYVEQEAGQINLIYLYAPKHFHRIYCSDCYERFAAWLKGLIVFMRRRPRLRLPPQLVEKLIVLRLQRME